MTKQNRIIHAFSIMITALCLTAVEFPSYAATSAIPSHPAKLRYDSLNWTVPMGDQYRVQLKNGLTAYIARDSSLPLVQISGYVRYGSIADPKGKEGVSDLMTTLIRTGGTKKFPADSLDELIDLMAMKIGFSASESQLTFSASFLSEYTNEALDILKQMLFYPAFDSVKLKKEKQILIESIRHQFDNPGPTLRAAYDKVMYPDRPPSRMETEKSVSSVTRADLIALHDKVFTTNNIIFSMAGDFNRDSMLVRLESMFPKAGATASTCAFPTFDNVSKVKGIFVNKKISQAYVRLGLPLFKRPDPDYYPVSVLDLILGGGGFTSRLGTKIRSDEGLTYSIYSHAESNYTYPSTFYIDFYTRNETFAKALKLTLVEVERLVKDGVTDKELVNAKASLVGELPSMFRTPFDIVSTYAWNEYYGRSPDHFKKYAGELNAITKEDILRVAGKYLKPESFTYTIVGDSTALKSQIAADSELSKLPIKFIDPNMIPRLP